MDPLGKAFGLRLAAVVTWACILASSAWGAEQAQTYVALFGGLTRTQPLQEVTGTGPMASVQFSNIDLMRSGVGGAKLGFVMPGRQNWMAIEAEGFYSTPHIRQQDLTVTVPGLSTSANFAGARLRVATAAVNWIVRYPGKYFQPYIGAGPGVFWGRMSGSELGTGSDTSLGLNALAGVKLFLGSHFAIFGEYKYNRVAFDFGGSASIHALYQAHHGVVGLALHF